MASKLPTVSSVQDSPAETRLQDVHEKEGPHHHEVAPRGVDQARNHVDAHNSVGLAVIEQRGVIPATGKRMITSKWEYWAFCMFYFSNNGAPISQNGGALRQLLLNLQYPSGYANWGGRNLSINSLLLDFTGIQFAAQLVCLLLIGPFADYGTWRPWIMIFFQCLLECCQFGMIGMSKPSQWKSAMALYITGTLAMNVTTAFYTATFPGLVRDLPELVQSEEEVKEGKKSPEEHAELDSYERATLYNLVNITGSAIVVITYAIALGITAGVGYTTDAELIRSYRVLMGYFGAITVICTTPFFLIQKHRPGQQLPQGTKWYLAGPQQVWQAVKCVRHLKQTMLYLIVWFMISETFGTYYQVLTIMQNEVVEYSTLLTNAMALVTDLAGGSGTLFVYLMQKKYRFSIKQGALYGAIMTLIPSLFGALGTFTTKVGFHHVWALWLAQVWNFQTGAWGSFGVAMISEVVPAPKSFLFFALFQTVGKTSGFIGPFISSAIIDRANGNTSASFWFLFAMGSLGAFLLYFVDTDKAKIENAKYLEREAAELYSEQQRHANEAHQRATEDEKAAA